MLTNSYKPGERFLDQVGGIVSTSATNEEPEQTRRVIAIQSIKANPPFRRRPILGRERILFIQAIRQHYLTGARHPHRSEERRVGKSVSVRVDPGGGRIITKKTRHRYIDE